MNIAAVILNYNNWQDTLECVESVLTSEYQPTLTVIVDNASTDDSVQQFQSWGSVVQKFLLKDKRGASICPTPCSFVEIVEGAATMPRLPTTGVILLRNRENYGYAGGNNRGIKLLMAKGIDAFWILNNDTIVDEKALEALVSRLFSKARPGLCGAQVRYFGTDTVQCRAGGTTNRWSGLSWLNGYKYSVTDAMVDPPEVVEQRINFIYGASVLVSRIFIETVGFMDERFFLYCEEQDWAYSAKRRFDLAYAPDAIIYHKEGRSTGFSAQKTSLRALWLLTRSRLLLTMKHTPWALPSVTLCIVFAAFRMVWRRCVFKFAHKLKRITMPLSLHYKTLRVTDALLSSGVSNSAFLTAPVRELAWLDRFPALKAALRITLNGEEVQGAGLQNGELQLREAPGNVHDAVIKLPYYTCDSLYRDHVVLPLDMYSPQSLPTWLNENLPLHFYSALVLLNGPELVVFDRDFDGYKDFVSYIRQNVQAGSDIQVVRWGIKVLASTLPRPIAVSREICFHLGHEDMSLPLHICISTTNACNLRCTICGSQAHLDALKVPREFIKRECFEQIAETMFPFCKTVELNSLGEPTLHKDFGHFVELINKYDCQLVLQTNGTNLTDEILQALKQTRGIISLSIDATNTIFEQQRVNASWKKVDANVRKLMAIRDKKKTVVNIYPTLTQRTAADVVPLCMWADEVGIDAINFHYYDPIIDGIEKCPTDEEKKELEQSLRSYINQCRPIADISLQYRRLIPQSLRKHIRKRFWNIKNCLSSMFKSAFKKRLFSVSSHPATGDSCRFPSGRYYDPNLPKFSPQQREAHPRYVCAAPLTNAVINPKGEISVCSKTQTTVFGFGLTDEAFYACWFGERMQAVRRSFLRGNPSADQIPECRECIAKFGNID